MVTSAPVGLQAKNSSTSRGSNGTALKLLLEEGDALRDDRLSKL